MPSRVTKVPALDVPQISDPAVKDALLRVTEALDVRLGRRGDPLDRAITLRELVDAGVVHLKFGSLRPSDSPGFAPGLPAAAKPPKPTGVTASAAFRTITVFWDTPSYANHSYAEIWRHDSNVLGDATLVGTSPTTAYTDLVEGAQTYYYWVRFVNASNVPGDFHSNSGVPATTAPDVDYLLDTLEGQVTTSQLALSLATKIDRIDDNTDAILEIDGRVDSLGGQYTVKIDVNGRVAGFGLANTSAVYNGGIHSEFAVRVDRFSIVNTDSNVATAPFIVTTTPTTNNGVSVPAGVYMTDAFIRNGAIVNAKIGNLAVDTAKIADAAINNAKIADAAISRAKIQNAAIGTAQIEDAAITNAKIGTAAITTAKIQDLAVDTIKITGNAVSQTAFTSTHDTSSISLNFTSRSGTVMVWAVFYPNSLTNRLYYLKRNGTTVQTLSVGQTPLVIRMFADAPSAGSVTYTAESTLPCNLIELQILEILR